MGGGRASRQRGLRQPRWIRGTSGGLCGRAERAKEVVVGDEVRQVMGDGPRWMWLYLGALEKGFALRCLRSLALATGLRINCRGVRAKAGDQFRGHCGISEEGVHGLGQHGSSRGAPLVGPFFLRTVSHPESLNPNYLADVLPYKCLVLALGQVSACTV